MRLQCHNCNYITEFPDEETWEDNARDNGWWEDEDGEWYCSDCHFYCEDCQNEFAGEGYIVEGDRTVCNACRDEHYDYCPRCEEYCYDDNMHRVLIDGREQYWCEGCIDNNNMEWNDYEEAYVPRVNNDRNENRFGGRLQEHLHQEDKEICLDCCMPLGFGNCPKCLRAKAKEMEEEETNLWLYDTRAMSYHHHDHNHFKETKLRMEHENPYLYYGMEFECLFRDSAPIEQITKEFIEATGGLFVAEYDRSVTNLGNGMEFISRPLSYKKWMDKSTYLLLKKGEEVLKKYRAFDPQPDGCGIHVHMSLKFFENNTTKKVKEIKSDIDWIFQVFQSEIEKLSQRPYTQYCASKAWRAKRLFDQNRFTDLGFNLQPRVTIEKGELTISAGSGATHHDAIVQTPKTIEVRTFRSTIKPEEMLAIIEFCRAIAHAARNMKLTNKTTLGDIIYCKDSNYLADLVKKTKVDTTKKFANKLEVKL